LMAGPVKPLRILLLEDSPLDAACVQETLCAGGIDCVIDRASSLPGGEQLGEARRVAAAQLGFDPLAREGLISAGFDPDRAAAVAFFEAQPRAELIAALPVSKPDLFLQTMQRLLVDRGGFSRAEGQSQSATLFERGGTRVAVSVVRGYGLFARTRDPAASIAEAGARQPEQSLARDPGLAAARNRLGAQDFVGWAPAGSGMPPMRRKITGRTRLIMGSTYWRGLSESPPRSRMV